MMDAQEDRRKIRRLLWRWGRVTEYCARRHRECADYTELIESATDIRPQEMTGMPHGTGTSDPTEKAAARVAKLRQLYEERIDELMDEIDEEMRLHSAIGGAVAMLKEDEQAILDLRYRCDMSYERIARKVGYTVRRAQQIEANAVDNLQEKIFFTSEGQKNVE